MLDSVSMTKGVKVGGVILAAGLSMRFGDEKLLADYRGKPVGSHVVEAALASRLEPVALVTRPELAPLLVQYSPGLRVVNNSNPLEGLALSLRLGLEALGEEVSHALVLLADQPLVKTDLINRFVAQATTGTGLAALSTQGDFCPPVLFESSYFEMLKNLSGDKGGRSILAGLKDKVLVLKTEDPLVTLDIDRPQDLKLISRRT